MKHFLTALFAILLFAGTTLAMSVEEIGKLSDLKTSESLILQLIEQNGLDKPIGTADVIYLREHGTSEKVIQYLLKLSEQPSKSSEQNGVQESSRQISDNLREYTTTKNGKTIRVVTNLDATGKRMGGPIPAPPAEEELYPEPAPPPTQEVYVTVKDERVPSRDEEYDYPEEPPTSGIPMYNGAYSGGYPYYYPGMYPGFGGHNRPPQQHWHANGAVAPIPPRPVRPSMPAPRMGSLPTRPSR